MSASVKAYGGSSGYIVSDELRNSVNIAIALQKPLLIKGEPGTGKTMLAQSIAEALNMDLIKGGSYGKGKFPAPVNRLKTACCPLSWISPLR